MIIQRCVLLLDFTKTGLLRRSRPFGPGQGVAGRGAPLISADTPRGEPSDGEDSSQA
jgi:hypothetical protein